MGDTIVIIGLCVLAVGVAINALCCVVFSVLYVYDKWRGL